MSSSTHKGIVLVRHLPQDPQGQVEVETAAVGDKHPRSMASGDTDVTGRGPGGGRFHRLHLLFILAPSVPKAEPHVSDVSSNGSSSSVVLTTLSPPPSIPLTPPPSITSTPYPPNTSSLYHLHPLSQAPPFSSTPNTSTP